MLPHIFLERLVGRIDAVEAVKQFAMASLFHGVHLSDVGKIVPISPWMSKKINAILVSRIFLK
jgi:hypothetical protein